jgi:anthranilate synthase component 1
MIESTVRGKNCYSRVVSGEKYTPMSLYRKLGGIALLESASFGMGRGRHSLLLVKEAFTIVDEGGRISLSTREGRERWEGEGDILDACMAYARFHENSEGRGDQPFPAGGIGYLSYEYVRNFEEVELREKPDSLGIPDACFVFGHLFLIFDHYRDTITILGLNYPGHEISLERAVDEVEHRLHDLDFNYMNTSRRQYESVSLVGEGDEERFLDGVVRVRREIEKGNLLQGVLSRRLIVRTELPSLEAYGRLRSLNPSPYMFFLDFGDFQFFGSSPEIHVKVEGRRVISRPIAGTRPRGKDRAEDLVL